jgi:hypothetical protein
MSLKSQIVLSLLQNQEKVHLDVPQSVIFCCLYTFKSKSVKTLNLACNKQQKVNHCAMSWPWQWPWRPPKTNTPRRLTFSCRASFIVVDSCHCSHFLVFLIICHSMAVATMARVILSKIYGRFDRYLANARSE